MNWSFVVEKWEFLALFYYHIMVLRMIFPFADVDINHDSKWQVLSV